MRPVSIRQARKAFVEAFKRDPDFRIGYQANIACVLLDRLNITDYETRNTIADEIIKVVFER